MAESFPVELLRTLVTSKLPGPLAALTFQPIPTGKHNTSYFVGTGDGELVLRIAPPDDAGFLFYERHMMAQEPEIHALLRERTTVPAARILAYDDSRTLIDRDYLLLERMAAAYLPQAQQLEIALQVTVEADVPLVNVDSERMAQVLGNLVSNALRYTHTGGQISLAATQQKDNVLLTVQDNGVGIAPDDLPRVFDRFYRGDEARQAHGGESGLGLTIAKSLVELHGGMITVESMLGEGTTFTIALPVGS